MVATERFECVFTGIVHPARCAVNIINAPLMTVALKDAGIDGTISICVDHSVLMMTFISDNNVFDIQTLKNMVVQAAQSYVDTLSFVNGCSYDVEITSYINVKTNTNFTFPVNILAIENSCENNGIHFEDILQLYTSENGKYLQMCLADLREAMKTPRKTAFHCYRGIEALRQYFVTEHGLVDAGKSWKALRNAVGVDKEFFDDFLKYSTPVRHGGDIFISDEMRASLFVRTWDVVCRYVRFGKNGYVLPKDL